MTDTNNKRTDSASRVIKAPPEKIYQAFLDPIAIAAWRPPNGMKCEIYEFNPHKGGGYRMSFGYTSDNHEVRGKTTEHADVFTGCFVELVPGKKIVESIKFESGDPAFADNMIITTTLEPVDSGTKVTFTATNVPEAIRPGDHQKGMTSTLENLAEFTE